MKLYLDDTRDAPDGWVLVRTVAAAIEHLQTGVVEELSLDYDLFVTCPDGETGADVLRWIEAQIDEPNAIALPVTRLHSANNLGRTEMEDIIRRLRARELRRQLGYSDRV